MSYSIYFDESNKLDQPSGGYSYYGAFGASTNTMSSIIKKIEQINNLTNSKNEMHFVDYTSDTNFEKYFRSLCHVIEEDVSFNIMIVNNVDAEKIADRMTVTMTELRKLFYVKIPERLFYGLTRKLKAEETIKITIDENDEYEKLKLREKLEEQMNAHSAYRNKGYKIDKVRQMDSQTSIPLQIIDTFIGIIVYIIEIQFKNVHRNKNIALKVKSDLIYRFLIQDNNIESFQSKVNIFKWEDNKEEITELELSNYLSRFIIDKSQYDIQQMNKIERIRNQYPNSSTKFIREKMKYSNRELKTILSYIDELDGKRRNGYYKL